MVLAERVGRQRPFWRGLLLTIVTAGIYAVYWNYKAHAEVFRQFELSREGRDEGVVWYVLGLVVTPALFGYFWIMASNVAYLRERLGLRRTVTPASFVGLVASGAGALFIGYLILAVAAADLTPESSEEEWAEVAAVAGGPFVLGLLVFVVAFTVAYRRMQAAINDLWDAYDARLAALTAPALRPPPPGAAATVPQAVYWADLPRPDDPRR